MNPPQQPVEYKPFVPQHVQMSEFTLRAVLLGLVLCVVLGGGAAYLGLRTGITVAATYPAAVISMAVLRGLRGSVLEENIARTAGSIGESVAAGAIFTIPAFVLTQTWASFEPGYAYWRATVLMMVGSVLGVLFVSLVRRVMVEDRELPFPESVAASEIHKAGQRGGQQAQFLFWNIGVGALVYLLSEMRLFLAERTFIVKMGEIGRSVVRLGGQGTNQVINTGAITSASIPSILPAYLGVGYIIGPRLAALNFAGGVLAWGLMVPLLLYFLGPQLQAYLPPGSTAEQGWEGLAGAVWRFIVRPIAVGGMLVGAGFTLFRMRKSIASGLGRAFSEIRNPPRVAEQALRTDRYMSSKVVLGLIFVVFLCMIALYIGLSGTVTGGIIAAIVMLIAGFFFATVSGSLVGFIGSSNNPISGLTLSTLLIAAVLMVTLGVAGTSGVLAVLGVAAVVCVSSAVAGELLQDFKVGYILGGTPRTIQIVELIAVVLASLVMYFPLLWLHQGNINEGGTGFGDPKLAAPQAGLMAVLAQGIVGGEMAWPLVIVGIFFGFVMIMAQVRSPMLVSVGMYLPFGTTGAIFVGGVLRWVADTFAEKRGLNAAQKARVENIGILIASGMIAGESLMGLTVALCRYYKIEIPHILPQPSDLAAIAIFAVLALILIWLPLRNAGRPDEPAPPQAIM